MSEPAANAPRPLRWWIRSEGDVVNDPMFEAVCLPHVMRAGRALLGLSQGALAKAVGVSLRTITNIEGLAVVPDYRTVAVIRGFLTQAGVSADFQYGRLIVDVPLISIDPNYEAVRAMQAPRDATRAKESRAEQLARALKEFESSPAAHMEAVGYSSHLDEPSGSGNQGAGPAQDN